MTRRILTGGLVMGLRFAFASQLSAVTCERTCLLEQVKQFNADMLAHTTGNIALAPNVPPEERATREQLERLITSYFQGLTDHKPIEAEYDPRCDRYHSGNRVTHNARNGVENSGDVGCYESNLGPKPWGPATEVRIGLVDPERGIVIGYAILYYGDNPRRMQINEVFKILNGRIRMVDNIGLMEEGITTSGFTQ